MAEVSRFQRVGRVDWHIQEMGQGPLLLFFHGAGGATHTWRDILPKLAAKWRCVAVDLPGQGFTKAATLTRAGRKGMSEDVQALIAHEGWQPTGLVGHSAGAVLALDVALTRTPPPPVFCINAALARFEGMAGWLFPILAKVLAFNPLIGPLFAMGSDPTGRARRLIGGTGSTLDEAGLACYGRLLSSSKHVDATLQMMARWEVDTLLDALPQLDAPVMLLAAEKDGAVPPATSEAAAKRLPHAELQLHPKLGHLIHEEAPETIAMMIDGFFARHRPG